MSITEIPRAFEYKCDVCGATHRQENAVSHYNRSIPPGWAHMVFRESLGRPEIKRLFLDAIDLLLCPADRERVGVAIGKITKGES